MRFRVDYDYDNDYDNDNDNDSYTFICGQLPGMIRRSP